MSTRREAKEETGIDLGEVRYLGSQPWPFPASLMMAFKAQALSTDILVDGEETETVRWVTRDEYTIELSEGRMEAPGKSTIARYMRSGTAANCDMRRTTMIRMSAGCYSEARESK